MAAEPLGGVDPTSGKTWRDARARSARRRSEES
jgi:hypothetical protein